MKRPNFMLRVCIFCGVLASCQTIETNSSAATKPVVEAYLIPGQPVSMHVSRQAIFETGESMSAALGLSPVFMTGGNSYNMTEQLSDSTYRLPGVALKAGDVYSVQLDYFGQSITSTTTIPQPPANFAMSVSELTITPFNTGTPGTIPTFPDPVKLTWTNPTQEYHLILVKNIETSPVAINSGNITRTFSFRSSPVQSGSYELNAMQFQYYGRHWIILYRINAEYAALYQDNGNSSLTIKTPYSNVTNGLGIFTGVNADTLILNVKKN